MKKQLEEILASALADLDAADSEQALRTAQTAYLGKKGALTAKLRGMGRLSAEERPVIGALANEVRGKIEAAIDEKLAALRAAELEKRLKNERVDVTLPATDRKPGRLHPLS